MTNCHVCGHPRLLHDSWGCKEECRCGVSIIYLAPQPSSKSRDHEVEARLIEQGNELVRQADRLGESHVRSMLELEIPRVELQ